MTLTKEYCAALRAVANKGISGNDAVALLNAIDAKDAEIERLRLVAAALYHHRVGADEHTAKLRAQLELLRVAGSHAVRITTAP